MGIPSGGNGKSSDHGSVYFYDDDAASNAIMASMVRLEAARVEEQQNSAENIARQLSPAQIEPITVSIIAAIIGGIGATAAVTGAVAGTTTAAINVASAANQSEAGGLSSLEVVFENKTSTPIVLASYSTDDCSASSMPGPLLPGDSASATIVSSDTDGWDKGSTDIEFNFLVGGGVNATGETLTPVTATCKVAYDSSGNWMPSISIDGSDKIEASDKEQAFAAFFTTGNTTILDFTIAMFGTEKSTSELWVQFLPGSSIPS
ncbi:MAG: hypothetical protein AAGE94_02215 [Acidobacteriota bacterium]